MADCIFCKIASHEIPSHSVWESDHFFAFLDLKPINPGHLLIIPKTHAEVVFDLTPERYAELFEAAKTLSAPLQRATDAARIGIAVEGFGVAHAHVHLVPLHGIGELNPERAQEAREEDLAAMEGKIKKEIEKSS